MPSSAGARGAAPRCRVWLAAVAEYEALCALATYRAEHPERSVSGDRRRAPPLFEARRARASAAAARHGRGQRRARSAARAPHLLLVSGSNMSGKSTLLRTVGLNAVLAQAGAPVRAARLTMTPLAIGATLRIQDSLQAGRSRFFAEITRISDIVALTQTASADATMPDRRTCCSCSTSCWPARTRTIGCRARPASCRACVERGAIGLATTHDLALTAIAERLGRPRRNVHFEDRFEDGVLTFDYRLKPGVVQSSNAIALMRAVGLDV